MMGPQLVHWFAAAGLLVAGQAFAEDDIWNLADVEVGSACAGPVQTFFTTTEGEQLESTRLDVTPDTAVWIQRAFFADGTPIFETEVALEFAAPEMLSLDGSAALVVSANHMNTHVSQGSGGNLTYSVTAHGAELAGIDAKARIDARNPHEQRNIALMPGDDTVEVSLNIRGAPCALTWTWRRVGAEVQVVEAESTTRVDPAGASEEIAIDPACEVGAAQTGTVRALRGDVDLFDPATGRWSQVGASPLPLHACMIVRTDEADTAELVIGASNGARAILIGNGVADAPDDNRSLSLRHGRIHLSQRPAADPDFVAAAPQVLAPPLSLRPIEPAAGYEFVVHVAAEPPEAALLVNQGAVETGFASGAARLEPGQALWIEAGVARPVATIPAGYWNSLVTALPEAVPALVASSRDFEPPEAETAAPEVASTDNAETVMEPAPAEPVQPAAPARPATDPHTEANKLVVHARRLVNAAAGLTGEERRSALQEALDALNRIIDDYPGTDHAVSLIGGDAVAGVSIPGLERDLADAVDPVEPATEAVAESDPAKPLPAPSEATSTPSGPVRMTLKATLLPAAVATREGTYRFGIEYVRRVDAILSLFGMTGEGGAIVNGVVRNSPAALSGLLEGDLVVTFDGRSVDDENELADLIGQTPSSIPVELEIIRIGEGPEDFMAALLAAHAAGDKGARVALADAHYYGIGTEVDYLEALGLYIDAAGDGDAYASRRAGVMYEIGYGVDADLTTASRMYGWAAAAGDHIANHRLGRLYWNGDYWKDGRSVQDDAQAVRHFRLAAEAGIVDAYFYMAAAHHFARGAPRDHEEAARWYRRSIAESNSTNAYGNLGSLYYSGSGVERDYDEARRLFEQGAERGQLHSKYMLGHLYRNGYGVAIDQDRAIEQFRQAASENHINAMYWLGRELRDKGGQRDLREAYEWFRTAAEDGHPEAHYSLAIAYVRGEGVVRNYQRSGEHLFKAIEAGDDFAVEEMRTNAGAWHKDVRTELQRRLRQEGFYDGRLDGAIGPRSMQAIDKLLAQSR